MRASLVPIALLAAVVTSLIAPRPAAAQSEADRSIQREQLRLQRSARDAGGYLRLGGAYVQKFRETGDLGYLALADAALRRSRELAPASGAPVRFLAYVYSTRHEFAEAAVQAQEAIELDPADGDAYGVLGDAYLELGRYDRAGAAYGAMMGLKGDLASYGRLSGLKNVRGDARGAIEDLERAVAAGESSTQPRESIAWARSQLGAEHFAIGEIEPAEAQQLAALQTYPGYHRALAGLGQVRMAQGRLAEAAALYEKALAVAPLPEYAVALGDLDTALGRAGEARKRYALVEYIGRLNALNRVLYNRELGYFFADHDVHLDTALEMATRELEQRRDIYAHDLLAWALHKSGRSLEAVAPMDEALRLGTRDAKLFFHAGMIHRALGHRDRAREYLARALSTNPHFHVLQAATAREALADLSAVTAGRVAEPR